MTRLNPGRGVAVASLALVVLVLALILAGSGSSYEIHAEFPDAGQLVSGDIVTVGGHQVGSVGSISITANGLADVALEIHDGSIEPLRQGTIATIGQLSLTGAANRFVSLSLGVGSPIPSGGTLGPAQTRGIVDLDTLLDSLTPPVRSSLDRLLASGAYLVSSPTAKQLNRAEHYLNPAFSQAAALGGQVVADDRSLAQVVAGSATVASALAAPSTQLGRAVSATAATLRELASERTQLEDLLVRAPSVLTQGAAVLGHVDPTLAVLDPALADLRPVAPRIARLLAALLPASQRGIALVRAVGRLVPGAEAALERVPAVEREATPAIRSLTAALLATTPVLSGLRPYAPDVVGGFFNGVGGSTAGAYDANGHFLHGQLILQGGGSSLGGLLNLFGKSLGSAGPLGGERTGLLAPCPGGGGLPAPDGSNPWTSPDVLASAQPLCKPMDDQR